MVMVMVNILRYLDLLSLAKFAATNAQMREYACTVFCRGNRYIEIDDTQRVADSKMILLQFGHLARSISVNGADKQLDILDVLSSVGSTMPGTSNMRSLELSSFYLDLLKLTFNKHAGRDLNNRL